MPPPTHRNGASRGQHVVRVNALEATLANFNNEIGKKMALTVAQYHAMHVAPLEHRLIELEAESSYRALPWVVRLRGQLTRWWATKRAKVNAISASRIADEGLAEKVVTPNDGSPLSNQPIEVPQRKILTLDTD